MNINTLNSEPLTSKTGKLAIALYPNSLTGQDGSKKQVYYAKVVNRSRLLQEDIADDLIANGTGLSKEGIMSTWRLINNAVICRLADGLSVETGLGTLRPCVLGSFESEGSEFNKDHHRISVLYRPDRQLKEIMASLTPVITQGNRILPEIISVQDKSLPAGSEDRLSPGGFFSIRGRNIMVVDGNEPDESGNPVGLYFDCVSDASKSVRLVPSQIYHNSTGLLEGIIPQLESGNYRVRVVTRFSKSGEARKLAQEDCFDREFTVA